MTWPLVARSQELERIETARADGSVGVLIQGSAGVGKSRLAREALARAERHHALTGWVQRRAAPRVWRWGRSRRCFRQTFAPMTHSS
ncbi:MAG: ATP-binding protein [Solirubrobacterales bacterium]|nr:ATP-binding protein [Solirubrobacterales bacterium]